MASNNKKRPSSKRSHIFLLRGLVLLSFLLLLFTLGLQILNLLLPVTPPTEAPSLLGKPSSAFHFNRHNLFPFLLAPLLVLVVSYLYLMRYFARNSISAMDHIPYFRKHPHTKLGRRFCTAFTIATTVLSAVLAISCHWFKGISEALFGVIVVLGCGILISKSAKKIRHIRRQYFAHRKHAPAGTEDDK